MAADPARQLPPIYVTQPELPPLGELVPLLEEIWERRVLTNGGPLHERFRHAVAGHLGLRHVALFNNATSALIAALRQQGVSGEVITTPFSFAASAHSIAWCGAVPVFADIEPRRLNLDPAAVERAITPRTTAILPVHCYGHPCDVAALADIARRHGLRLIYDAAHAFGVTLAGRSLLQHGDLSVVSFHATKVFNTFEGGAVIAPDETCIAQLDRLRNFGIVDEATIESVGFNGKMSEFNAAVGLLQLRRAHDVISRRREVARRYVAALQTIEGIRPVESGNDEGHNFAYFPVLVDRPYPLTSGELVKNLAGKGIHCRRYFHPLLSDLPLYGGPVDSLPVARWAAQRIVCLPIYPSLGEEAQRRIIDALREPLA
jgi:dTDP-4-amino-4,6-dideoxygalactose transaminase